MAFITDVYYKPPANPAKEAVVTDRMAQLGGRLDLREDTDDHDLGGVCLCYAFDDMEGATKAADLLRELGEDFEGPYELRPEDWTEGREPAAIPFQPPADFAFEPELRGAPPRALPDAFRQSWFANKRRSMVRFLLVFGLFCLGMSLLPIMELWTEILPPLTLLFWGGVALVIGATLLNMGTASGAARRYDYVRRGVPIVARVRSILFGPQFGYYSVRFDTIDPELAELEKEEWQANLQRPAAATAAQDHAEPDTPAAAAEQTPVNFGLVTTEGLSELMPVGLKSKVSLTYHVGDYVTAVYLPGQRKQTIRLYGLLGLRNDLGVVFGVPVKPIGWGPLVLAMTGLCGFALAMSWNFYVWRRYWPLDRPADAFAWPLVLGALVFGALGALRGLFLSVRARSRPGPGESSGEWAPPPPGIGVIIFAILASAAVGGITMLCWFVTANVWFDEAPPTAHPVTLNNNPARDVTVLTIPIYRPCTMSGKFVADQRPFVHICPPAELAALEQDGGRMATQGVAEVRPGWLGWTWLDRIRAAPAKGP